MQFQHLTFHFNYSKTMKNIIAVFAAVFLLSITAKAQTLSGFVYDINGTPLPSSTVIVDGSSGVFCDYNGHYAISAAFIRQALYRI